MIEELSPSKNITKKGTGCWGGEIHKRAGGFLDANDQLFVWSGTFLRLHIHLGRRKNCPGRNGYNANAWATTLGPQGGLR
jgi:hypothetical protein